MKHWVAGLYFNRLLVAQAMSMVKTVALIHKRRPEWQAGKLNAIGGHMEDGEDPVDAMVREFAEETGINVPASRWARFAVLRGKWGVVHWFTADAAIGDGLLSTMTDEVVQWFAVDDLKTFTTLDNLPWLISMSDGRCQRDWPYVVIENYHP